MAMAAIPASSAMRATVRDDTLERGDRLKVFLQVRVIGKAIHTYSTAYHVKMCFRVVEYT